jgi:putative membrane protein
MRDGFDAMARVIAFSTACTAAFLLAACVDRERDREPYEYGVEDDTPAAQTLWEGKIADRAFVNAMISAGDKAIELSQLAMQASSTAEVKAFADEIIRDHRLANTRLRDLVSQMAIDVDVSSEDYQDDLKRLAALAPPSFDRQYMALMVGDHLEVLSALQTRIDRAGPGPLDRWASDALPMVHEHLERAQQLQRVLAA